MKNLIKILIISLIFISLNSCWKTEEKQTETTTDNQNIEQTTTDTKKQAVDTNTETKETTADDWNEYSFKLSVKNNLWMENSSLYYKKWDNQLIVIEKLIAPELEKMPIKIKRMLSVDKNIYQKMVISWKEYRTKTNANEMWWQTSFFNLKEVSKVPKDQIKETKEEKINGKDMTCYYFDDESWKGKGCLYKWIFMYWENIGANWEQTTMVITDYNEKVDNNIFKTPEESEITSMTEISTIIQEALPKTEESQEITK